MMTVERWSCSNRLIAIHRISKPILYRSSLIFTRSKPVVVSDIILPPHDVISDITVTSWRGHLYILIGHVTVSHKLSQQPSFHTTDMNSLRNLFWVHNLFSCVFYVENSIYYLLTCISLLKQKMLVWKSLNRIKVKLQ